MALSTNVTPRQPRWPTTEVRAAREADALIAEHGAAGDPDLIDAVAMKVLLMFEPDHPPAKIDLLVIDVLRAKALQIRTRRAC